MGADRPADRSSADRARDVARRAGRRRLDRRVVLGGRRHGCVHTTGPGLGMGADAPARHRDRAGVHPWSRPARDERGGARRGRAGPVRARHRCLVAGHRPGLERGALRRPVRSLPGRAALPAAGADRRGGRRGVPDIYDPPLPVRAAAAEPTADRARRPAVRDAPAGRSRGRRRDPQLARRSRPFSSTRGARRRQAWLRDGRAHLRLPDRRHRVRPNRRPPPDRNVPDRAGVRGGPPLARSRRPARADVARLGRGRPAGVDVTDEQQVRALVEATLAEHGRIDLFCSNAGITTGAGIEADAEQWQRSWAVNVLAHVYAARAVLPSMLDRGEGYLLQTCSAAGLLTAVGDAPYTVTKHAAVGFAEWLAVTYRGRGIRVSALCPQGVDTDMLRTGLRAEHVGARVTAASGRVLDAAEVAEAALAGIAEERFLILPHPEVAEYLARKTTDHERWLAGMQRLIASAPAAGEDRA